MKNQKTLKNIKIKQCFVSPEKAIIDAQASKRGLPVMYGMIVHQLCWSSPQEVADAFRNLYRQGLLPEPSAQYMHIGSESEKTDTALSCAELLTAEFDKTRDVRLVKPFLALLDIKDRKKLNRQLKLNSEDSPFINEQLSKLAGRESPYNESHEFTRAVFVMDLWARNYSSPEMLDCIAAAGRERRKTDEPQMAKALGLEPRLFAECEEGKRVISRLKAKAAEALNTNSDNLAGTAEKIITGRLPGSEKTNLYYEPAVSSLEDMHADQYTERKNIPELAKTAADYACMKMCEAVMRKTYTDMMTEGKKRIAEKTSVPKVCDASFSVSELLKQPKLTHISEIRRNTEIITGSQAAAFIMTEFEMLRLAYSAKSLKAEELKRFLDDKDVPDSALSQKIKSLKNEIKSEKKKHEKQIKDLKAENTRSLQNAVRADEEKIKKKVQNEAARRLEGYRARAKEAEKGKAALEAENKELKEKLSALREQNAILKTAKKEERPLPEINTEARYLFVVDEDRMKQKLTEWFPNCMLSETGDITRFTRIDMVVFICTSVRHSEYRRIKNKCISRNIPAVYCNFTNYEQICRTIAEAMPS